MSEPTLQQVLHQHLADYTRSHRLDGQRLKVCRHLMSCHTPALGGLKYQCESCQAMVPRYHSCRDRHCPACQQRASRQWVEKQCADILALVYYHLVFTLPHELNGWCQLHPAVIYRLLFHCAWRTLKAFGADPKRLGGRLGMTAAMHTWGQSLCQHVHLHCLIPGGALGEDGQWHRVKGNYLFPVKALSRHFRGAFISALRKAVSTGQLHRVDAAEVDPVLDSLMGKDWVVYSKPCLHHTDSVLGYLARYSHRIAISNQRLIEVDEQQVRFRYHDYRSASSKAMSLEPMEFIRRFLMHILPKGLMRIRHYGLLANRCRRRAIEQIRTLLEQPQVDKEATTEEAQTGDESVALPCPVCKVGRLQLIGEIRPVSPELNPEPG